MLLVKQLFHSRLLDMRWLIIANSALRALLAIYHLMSNEHTLLSTGICYVYGWSFWVCAWVWVGVVSNGTMGLLWGRCFFFYCVSRGCAGDLAKICPLKQSSNAIWQKGPSLRTVFYNSIAFYVPKYQQHLCLLIQMSLEDDDTAIQPYVATCTSQSITIWQICLYGYKGN